MRTDIYYWKCDNPLPLQKKLNYNDKYLLANISEMVHEIAMEHFGHAPLTVESNGSMGNHYAYVITMRDKKVFFRADDGQIDDDYMDAEEAVMDIVRERGVPVPQIYRTDTSLSKYPVRYQLMQMIAGKSLNEFHQAGTLDKVVVGRQIGRCIASFHQIQYDGYGFINTERLKRENLIAGLDGTNRDYFFKKLENHLRYLIDSDFLSAESVREIETLFQKSEPLLNMDRGSLVHKDLAFWNMIGETDKLHAIVDWDDVVIGDPVDDLAIIRCFYNEDVFNPILEGYQEIAYLPDHFYPKLWLYLVRNMLWKAVIRIFMRYFEMKGNLFILHDDQKGSLRQFTYDRLNLGLSEMRKLHS